MVIPTLGRFDEFNCGVIANAEIEQFTKKFVGALITTLAGNGKIFFENMEKLVIFD